MSETPKSDSLGGPGHSPLPPAPAGVLALLDNAAAGLPFIDPGLDAQRKIAADPTKRLAERLEAYEDITESEVGDTSLSRGRNLERETGLRQLFLKFEGGNPTGSQKDRIASAQVLDALRRKFKSITVATCGNYGAAMALAGSLAGIRCLIYIPEGYHTGRIKEIEDLGAEIIRTPGDYEAAVVASRKSTESERIYDANPGGPNTSIQIRAYGEIAYEIYDELRDAPAVVAVPASNGTTLAGVYRGFLSLYRRGKTSRMPRVVAGSSHGNNPILQAWLNNRETCEDLDQTRIRESVINEPLVNWHSIDGNEALHAVRSTGGWAGSASDRDMTGAARMIRGKEGLSVLPASTAGLVALLDHHAKTPLPPDRYVAVLTGRKT